MGFLVLSLFVVFCIFSYEQLFYSVRFVKTSAISDMIAMSCTTVTYLH
jgi:hypothetical protein